MSEIIIHEEPEEESGEVLAEAAVASAAMAGHASAQAERAVEWTGEVAEEVEEVEALATHAAVEAASKPDRHEVESLVDTKIESAFDRLAGLLAERMTPRTEEIKIEKPKKDEAPASVKKSKKKKSFAERYLGMSDEGEE